MLNTRLLIFSKVPEIGKVKTRMQPVCSPQFSVDLHQHLVRYCLRQYLQSKLTFSLHIAGTLSLWRRQFPEYSKLPLVAQLGEDLGERLYAAAIDTLAQGVDAVVLVGTDCPFVCSHYLEKANLALLHYDCVIGPAHDGGYVLLAIKSSPKALFQCIDWGTERVFEQTLAVVQDLQWSYCCLESLPDIDYPEDLQHLKTLSFFDVLLEHVPK